MKKTQFIDLITTVRRTAVSFIAITVFIALGLGFYGGASWGVEHTEKSLNQTYMDANMRTLFVTDVLGLSQEQILQIEDIEGVDKAEGQNIIYRFFEDSQGVRQLAAMVEITDSLDKLMNVEGTLPSAPGETAVLRSWAQDNNIAIGDLIAIQEEDASDYREFQSVRKVASWDGEEISTLEFSTEDPAYPVSSTLKVTALVDSSVYLSTNPYAHGVCSANGLYVDAAFFVSEEEMPPEAFGGYTSVLVYSQELNSMGSFSDEYKEASQALSDKVQQLIDEWDSQLISDFGKSTDSLRKLLDTFKLQTGSAYAEGEQLYNQLDQRYQELSSYDGFSGISQTDTNNSYLTADNLIGVLGSLRSVLGFTFLAIGILICYSVVSRLVADSAVWIGTRKALGFYKWELFRLYFCYVGAALLIGAALSLPLGTFLIEFGFVKVLAAQFTFSQVALICNPLDLLPVFLVIGAIIFGVTYMACAGEIMKNAIDLLQKAFKDGSSSVIIKRYKLFNRLSTLNKTVLLNLMRDRKRVFGMITGIAGAATLLCGGLTFCINFERSFSAQFENYYLFDYEICYNADSDSASEEIRDILEEHGLSYARAYTSCFILHTPDGKTNAPNVVVPADTEEFSKLMRFDIAEGENISFDSGLWMSEYYRYAFDAEEGSLLSLQTLDGKRVELAVDKYYRHHLSTPVIVMDEDTYQQAFGENAAPNTFFVYAGDFDMNQLKDALNSVKGFIYTYDCYDSFQTTFSSEEVVVIAFAVIFGIMAVLMALMTIINLMSVYINEKKKELIILMINGYERKFAKRYIYRDTIALTIIGILLGLTLGSLLGELATKALEGTSLRLIHDISFISCGISAVITALITVLVCKLSLRKVNTFQLSDIDIGR